MSTKLMCILAMALARALSPSPDPATKRWQAYSNAERGVDVTVQERQSRHRTASRAPAKHSNTAPAYEYRYLIPCMGNTLNNPAAFNCARAAQACAAGAGPGPLTHIWRRQHRPKPGPWLFVRATCSPPTPSTRRAISVERIRNAWTLTPFAKPVLRIQPPGGRTLINIPTYVMADIPQQGFGPGEINTITMLGQRVRIKASRVEYRYDFGDGTPPLRTTSPGGPWPDGDVTHTYRHPAFVTVRIDTTYHGAYAIDDGPWQPITPPVAMTSPPESLEIDSAHNQLLPN